MRMPCKWCRTTATNKSYNFILRKIRCIDLHKRRNKKKPRVCWAWNVTDWWNPTSVRWPSLSFFLDIVLIGVDEYLILIIGCTGYHRWICFIKGCRYCSSSSIWLTWLPSFNLTDEDTPYNCFEVVNFFLFCCRPKNYWQLWELFSYEWKTHMARDGLQFLIRSGVCYEIKKSIESPILQNR